MTGVLPIKRGELHVWFAFPDEVRDPALLHHYHGIMDSEEKKKHDRYRFEKDRHTCLITRALARSVLARYTGAPPASLSFSKNSYGRPELIEGPRQSGLRFNLSHTHGLVVCAVTLSADVGIDVESIDRKTLNLDIADRFFSKQEADELRTRPKEIQPERFMEYWTLKESYIKARGMGLSIPLNSFSFHLEEKEPVTIAFDKSIDDDPSHWQFFLLDPGNGFRVAVSVHKKEESPFTLAARSVVPLFFDEPFSLRVIA